MNVIQEQCDCFVTQWRSLYNELQVRGLLSGGDKIQKEWYLQSMVELHRGMVESGYNVEYARC